MDREAHKESCRRYYHNNKEKFVALRKQWHKMKPSAYYADLYSARVRMALKKLLLTGRGTKKFTKTETLLGCTLEEFKQHLESQFTPEMNWKNIGKVWTLDHKEPCSYFNLCLEMDVLICYNFNNYQPMLKLENQSKFTTRYST